MCNPYNGYIKAGNGGDIRMDKEIRYLNIIHAVVTILFTVGMLTGAALINYHDPNGIDLILH